MLILSFVFLTLAALGLANGKLFHGVLGQMAEETVKGKEDSNYRMDSTVVMKGTLFILFSIGYMITYALYLNFAIDIDTMIYPTLFMIAYYIFNFVKGVVNNKKNKLETREELDKFKANAKKKYTLIGFVGNSISLVYHCYIIYLLVFV